MKRIRFIILDKVDRPPFLFTSSNIVMEEPSDGYVLEFVDTKGNIYSGFNLIFNGEDKGLIENGEFIISDLNLFSISNILKVKIGDKESNICCLDKLGMGITPNYSNHQTPKGNISKFFDISIPYNIRGINQDIERLSQFDNIENFYECFNHAMSHNPFRLYANLNNHEYNEDWKFIFYSDNSRIIYPEEVRSMRWLSGAKENSEYRTIHIYFSYDCMDLVLVISHMRTDLDVGVRACIVERDVLLPPEN